MKLGYSILLGEYVNATEVDYGDCETFVITCPSCHEAVYKAGAYGADRQYFSHYAASKSNVEECELRVRLISEKHQIEANLIGHGQTLEKFFGRFQRPLLEWLFNSTSYRQAEWAPTVDGIKKEIMWMTTRPSFIRLIAGLRNFKKASDEQKNHLWNFVIKKEIKDNRSKLWIDQQLKFASDFFDHLIAANSGSALAFMVALATYCSMRNNSRNLLVKEPEKVLKKALSLEGKMVSTGHITSLYHVLSGFVVHDLWTLLLLIPYFDIINNNIKDVENRDIFFTLMNQRHGGIEF